MQALDKHQKVQQIDVIRGIAILAVFMFHCLSEAYGFTYLPWKNGMRSFDVPQSFLLLIPITYGWVGVPIFFAISGFCIHLSHVRSSDKSIRIFFLKRTFRIYPPYLVTLLIFGFVYPWATIARGSDGFLQFITHLFLLHNYHPDTNMGINASFWSIAVEFQLYLLYPLLAWAVLKSSWRTLLWIAGILEVCLRLVYGFYPGLLPEWAVHVTGFGVLSFGFSWAVGAHLADSILRGKHIYPSFCLILFPVLTLITAWIQPLYSMAFPLASLSTVVWLEKFLTQKDIKNRSKFTSLKSHLIFAGTISYSMYLIHQPVIPVFLQFFVKMFRPLKENPLAMYGVSLLSWIPILFLSWISWRFLEIGSINLGKRFNNYLNGKNRSNSREVCGIKQP